MFFRKSEEDSQDIKPRKKEEDNEWQWDKKRILIISFFALVLGLIAWELKGVLIPGSSSILGEKSQIGRVEKPDIKAPSINFSADVGSKVEDIKENIENLSPEEIASSSPQIQKVLNDIGQIRNLPINQAREACLKVCSSL